VWNKKMLTRKQILQVRHQQEQVRRDAQQRKLSKLPAHVKKPTVRKLSKIPSHTTEPKVRELLQTKIAPSKIAKIQEESKDEKDDMLKCPNCSGSFEVTELNCGIFRHATFISNGKQVPPHANKVACDRLVSRGMVRGCCRPFKVTKDKNDKFFVTSCGYV
jgi:hypothetical protein